MSCHVGCLVGLPTTIKEKCLREGSGSGKLLCVIAHALENSPSSVEPGAVAGTHRRTMTRPVNAPQCPSLLPLASMQTLDAATFESRFQIREQILFQIPFNRDDPNIGESHWSLTAPAKLAIHSGTPNTHICHQRGFEVDKHWKGQT